MNALHDRLREGADKIHSIGPDRAAGLLCEAADALVSKAGEDETRLNTLKHEAELYGALCATWRIATGRQDRLQPAPNDLIRAINRGVAKDISPPLNSLIARLSSLACGPPHAWGVGGLASLLIEAADTLTICSARETALLDAYRGVTGEQPTLPMLLEAIERGARPTPAKVRVAHHVTPRAGLSDLARGIPPRMTPAEFSDRLDVALASYESEPAIHSRDYEPKPAEPNPLYRPASEMNRWPDPGSELPEAPLATLLARPDLTAEVWVLANDAYEKTGDGPLPATVLAELRQHVESELSTWEQLQRQQDGRSVLLKLPGGILELAAFAGGWPVDRGEWQRPDAWLALHAAWLKRASSSTPPAFDTTTGEFDGRYMVDEEG